MRGAFLNLVRLMCGNRTNLMQLSGRLLRSAARRSATSIFTKRRYISIFLSSISLDKELAVYAPKLRQHSNLLCWQQPYKHNRLTWNSRQNKRVCHSEERHTRTFSSFRLFNSHRNAAIKYSHHFYQYRHTANTPKSRHGYVDFSLSKGEDVAFAP